MQSIQPEDSSCPSLLFPVPLYLNVGLGRGRLWLPRGLPIPPLLINGVCGEKCSNVPKCHVFTQFKPCGSARALWLPRGLMQLVRCSGWWNSLPSPDAAPRRCVCRWAERCPPSQPPFEEPCKLLQTPGRSWVQDGVLQRGWGRGMCLGPSGLWAGRRRKWGGMEE